MTRLRSLSLVVVGVFGLVVSGATTGAAASLVRPRTVSVAPTHVVSLAQDGGMIAVGAADCRVRLVDAATGRTTQLPKVDREHCPALLFLGGTRAVWASESHSNTHVYYDFVTAALGERKAHPIAEPRFYSEDVQVESRPPLPFAGDADTLVYYVLTRFDADPDPLGKRIWRVRGSRSTSVPGTGGTVALAAHGGSFAAVRVTGEEPYMRPARSADGRHVAWLGRGSGSCGRYVKPSSLWVSGSDGSAARELVRCAQSYEWAPTGSLLAVHSGAGLEVLGADGSGRRKVGDGGSPTWSPDGSSLAVVERGDSPPGGWPPVELQVVPLTGRAPRTIARNPATGTPRDEVWIDSPSWSPDGRRVAYLASEGFADASRVYVVDAAGGTPRALGPRLGDWPENPAFAWSPDSRTLAVSQFHAGLVVVDTVTGASRRIRGLTPVGPVAWSPDSTRIAFAHSRWRLGVVRRDGSGLTWLGPGRNPSWDRTGGKILHTVPSPADASQDGALAEFDLKTGKAVAVRPSSVLIEIRRTATGAVATRFRLDRPPTAVALTDASVVLLVDHRLQVRSRSGTLRRSIPVPAPIDRFSAAGSQAAYADGRAIWAVDLLSGRKTLIARTARLPVGVSLEGNRVVWAEGRRVLTVELVASR